MKGHNNLFKKHKESKTHCEAVEAVVTSPSITKDVGVLLSTAHKHEKQVARDKLKILISSVQYLARQGYALRGHNDSESNLIQLLNLKVKTIKSSVSGNFNESLS